MLQKYSNLVTSSAKREAALPLLATLGQDESF